MLQDTPQSPKHHPEGSVWNHTLMGLDNAAERKHLSNNPQVLMWAALLGFCDRLGRGEMTPLKKQEEERTIEKFLARCMEILKVKGDL